MCEHEEGWHPSSALIEMNNFETIHFAYLARIMNFLKLGHLATELKIFLTKHENNLLKEVDLFLSNNKKSALKNDQELIESYISIRNYFISQLGNNQSFDIDLQR